jgi:D-inositol-3-phosphate glycosyltransferase
MNVSVYNGTGQADYLYGLISGLHNTPIRKIDILDIDLSSPLFSEFDNVEFHKVYKYQQSDASIYSRLKNIISYYYLQFKHLVMVKPRIVHFQWLDRFYFLDRIILPAVARLFGHKVILTVHNVNARKRDNNDSLYNRFTLSILYKLCNQLIVHTQLSQKELVKDFNIETKKISIIKHGMNNKVTSEKLNQKDARTRLGIIADDKVVLFFGNIDYYKGLDLLIESLDHISIPLQKEIKLIIAGNSKSPTYIEQINEQLENSKMKGNIIPHIQYIQDEDIERYFMAADCIVLPYRNIYQSGVIFMAYNFGLPILATRVGNFENDIISGMTGFLIDTNEPSVIAKSIEEYFESSLYLNLQENREKIKEWSNDQFSWDKIGKRTYELYKNQLNGSTK